jgi:predicted Zn finger-like uncharacterized protein
MAGFKLAPTVERSLMIVTCPECLTKFRFDEENIPEEGIKVRCSRCQHIFSLAKPAPAEESFYAQDETLAADQGDEAIYPRPSRRWFFHWKWAALVLLAAVVGGGIFYLGKTLTLPRFSTLGKYVDEKAGVLKKFTLNSPLLKRYLGIKDPNEGYLALEKVRGYYLENNNLNRVFVIEGEAVNHWKESRSFIKVKGVLLDSKGNKVQEKEVYCGNLLSEKDLKEMNKAAIEKSLSSQFGISFSNVNLQPDKTVPFMIVFMDLPSEKPAGKAPSDSGGKTGDSFSRLTDFTVEIVGSQKGSK